MFFFLIGTNGGVSVAGLFASVLGGLIVGVTYYLTLLLSINHRLLYKSPSQWPIVLQGMICGFIGSLIDSFLGATVQFSGKEVYFQKNLLLSKKLTICSINYY